jgi:hypothetical protein
MKKALVFVLFSLLVVAVSCSEQEEPLICHLYGYMINDITQTGVNGLIVRIIDINPYDVYQVRLRYDTTATKDSVAGFFEMDSVCYGTNKRQGNLVNIAIDNSENPGWPNQGYTPDIDGAVDTVYIYIQPGD